VVEYARYYWTCDLGDLLFSGRLLSPLPRGLCESPTVSAPAPDEREVSKEASTTGQEVSGTDKGEVGKVAPAIAQEVYTSSVSGERQSGRSGPSAYHCQALCRAGYGRQLRRG
jgi:hypothetical protein